MPQKDRIDAFGAIAMISFSALLGVNQVAIKLANAGLQPVFAAGLRSLGGVVCVWAMFSLLGRAPRLRAEVLGPGVLSGLFFALEFIFLYQALDLTSVIRTSIIFYSMPVWAALGAHVLLPGERLTARKSAGLALAFGGVVWALIARGGASAEASSVLGDVCALGASLSWAAILIMAKGTALRSERAESQLWWQVVVSTPILLGASLAFGPFLRDPDWVTWTSLAFQIVIIVTFAFVLWFWLLTIYPAASVAAFGFLSPIFGVTFGWLFLGETLRPAILGALVLVAAGLWLINRPARLAARRA